MTKLMIVMALLFTLSVTVLSQSENIYSNKDLVTIFKKAANWSVGETSVKIREVKLKSCDLSYKVLTRTPLSGRVSSSDRAPGFAEITDVDANADLSKNFINTRFVSFSLSEVDISQMVIEKGFANETLFIRVPLRNSSAVISAKTSFGQDAAVIGDTKRPTIVVRTDAADEFVRVFTSAVQACSY